MQGRTPRQTGVVLHGSGPCQPALVLAAGAVGLGSGADDGTNRRELVGWQRESILETHGAETKGMGRLQRAGGGLEWGWPWRGPRKQKAPGGG